MLLDNLLSSDAYTPVNKFLSRKLGFECAGYLGELIRQRARFGGNDFYFKQKDMEDELGISEYAQRQYVKKLTTLGLISVEKKGIPCKYYFTINDLNILKLFNEQELNDVKNKCFKIGSTGATKIEAHNNNVINKKDNKIESGEDFQNGTSYNDKTKTSPDIWEKFRDLTLSEKVIEVLKDYNDSRKTKLTKLTDKGLKLFVDKLKKFGGDDEGMIAVLEQSIVNGWEGIFELKGKSNIKEKEPSNNTEWIMYFDKCWEEGTHREKILNKYGREKFEKVKKIWGLWCATKTIDNSFTI